MDNNQDYERFDALRQAFRNWPKLPSPLALQFIPGNFPEDWERGKQMQAELKGDAIPWKTECEIGAGAWDRMTNGAWRT